MGATGDGATPSMPRSIVLLVAGRILRRTGTAPVKVIVAAALGGLALVVGGVGISLGAGPWALATVLFGALVGVSASLALYFVPTVAASTTGIAWGVASLFCVMAVTSGFETELLTRIGQLNGQVLVTKYGLDFFEWEAVSDELARRPDVRGASPFVFGGVALQTVEDGADAEQGGGEPIIAGLKGVDRSRLSEFEGVSAAFESGGLDGLRPGAFHTTPPGVVVGERLARRLGARPGRELRVVAAAAISPDFDAFSGAPRAETFEVTDRFATGVSDLDEALVLVDLRAGMSLLYGEGRVTGIELQLEDVNAAQAVAAAISEQLNQGRHMPLYRVHSAAEGSHAVILIQNIRRVVSLVLALIVVVAASTLIGALLLTVRLRRRQIAILSTVGATRGTLFMVFEAAGLVAGAAGAAAGLLLGGIVCLALAKAAWPLDPEVYPLGQLPVAPDWMDAVVPALVAISLCALVSGPVAWHAAKTRPIDALR